MQTSDPPIIDDDLYIKPAHLATMTIAQLEHAAQQIHRRLEAIRAELELRYDSAIPVKLESQT